MWSAGMQGGMSRRGVRRFGTLIGSFLLAGVGSWWLTAMAQVPTSSAPNSQAPNSPERGAATDAEEIEGAAPFGFVGAGRSEAVRESAQRLGEESLQSAKGVRESLSEGVGGPREGEGLPLGNAREEGNASVAGPSRGLNRGGTRGQAAGAEGVPGGAAAVSNVASAGEVIGFSHVDASGSQRITLVDTGKSWMAVYHIDQTGTIRLVSSRPIDADFSLQLNATSPLPEEIRQLAGPSR